MPEVHAVPSRMPSRAPLRLAIWTCAVVTVLAASLLLATGEARADDPAAAGGAVATASSLKVLKRGSRGPEVRRVQRRLRIQADGIFGRGTARAVRRFQRRKGLVADGIVGPITARALGIGLARGTRRQAATAPAGVEATLRKIALCESGGDPRAVSPDGQYRGKYQFSRPTWEGLGGKGDPAKASEAEQDRLARKLYEQRGAAPWPNCA